LNIESLRIFCRVVEEGSITKAARLSYISQPAVTRQIHQLEEKYGTLLFEREDGKLRLSEAGAALYPFAKEMDDLVRRSFEEVGKITGAQETVLHVGASLTIGEYLLHRLTGSFRKRFPDIKFIVTIGNTPSILAKLESNDIDLALVEGAASGDEFIIEKFAEDELILVVYPEHPWSATGEIGIHEIGGENLIWRESESGTRHIVEAALKECGALDNLEITMELGSYQSIKSAVEAGLGISILPKLTVSKELTYGTLQEVKMKDFHLKRGLWMVQKYQRFQKEGLNHFIENILMSKNKGNII